MNTSRPSHVEAAISRGRGGAVQPRASAPVRPQPAAHVARAIQARLAPGRRPAVLQRALETSIKTQEEIEGIFRGWAYPIGGSSQKLAGGTGTYDVGAAVYDSGGTRIGSGVYSSGDAVHAEMAALENALASGYGLVNVAKIRVTKGCCRRCAVVMKMLGLVDKIGPNTKSSTYSGAYKIPPNVRAALATKLTKYHIDDMANVVEKGTWW